MPVKFLSTGVSWVLWKGGVEVPVLFLWAWGFSEVWLHPFPRGSLWEGKTGSICHFEFSLVLQCLGADAGKNSTRSVIVTPLFECLKN